MNISVKKRKFAMKHKNCQDRSTAVDLMNGKNLRRADYNDHKMINAG